MPRETHFQTYLIMSMTYMFTSTSCLFFSLYLHYSSISILSITSTQIYPTKIISHPPTAYYQENNDIKRLRPTAHRPNKTHFLRSAVT